MHNDLIFCVLHKIDTLVDIIFYGASASFNEDILNSDKEAL